MAFVCSGTEGCLDHLVFPTDDRVSTVDLSSLLYLTEIRPDEGSV